MWIPDLLYAEDMENSKLYFSSLLQNIKENRRAANVIAENQEKAKEHWLKKSQ